MPSLSKVKINSWYHSHCEYFWPLTHCGQLYYWHHPEVDIWTLLTSEGEAWNDQHRLVTCKCWDQTLSDINSKDAFGPFLSWCCNMRDICPELPLRVCQVWPYNGLFTPAYQQCKNLTLPLKLMWFTNLNLNFIVPFTAPQISSSI